MPGGGTSALQVRTLYKAILRLHRSLPFNFQVMGDQYVKDEFRLHKSVPKAEADIFMKEWSKYYVTLAKQLTVRKKRQSVGQNMSPEFLDCFSDEQVAQLGELHKEATDPQEVADS